MANQEAVEALRSQAKWRKYIQEVHKTGDFDFSGADLRGVVTALDKAWTHSFNHRANFTNCIFSDFLVSEMAFPQGIDFTGSTFHGRAQFSLGGGQPCGLVIIRSARFKETVYMQAGYHSIQIENCIFEKGLSLGGTFQGSVEIIGRNTDICGDLQATHSVFNKKLIVADIRVHTAKKDDAGGGLIFRGCTFAAPATFANLTVEGVANFSQAQFHARTDFRGTRFGRAPIFEGASLNVETEFDVSDALYSQFPDTKSEGAEQRYRVLKTMLGAHNALSEQQAFARLEMKAYAERHPGKANLYRAYELFSDYGLSWRRPLAWLIGLMMAIAALFIAIGVLEGKYDWAHLALLALSNAFPFVGGLKALQLDAAMEGLSPAATAAIAILSVVQNVASTLLLFLVALGIRNRLRMK
ncbi:MAG: pentapeptide repeat-containing protein [Rhodospirillaceae bacterium]|nr:pentapeptide repeat-containing protein [Rhodospirillaceae bacterium]